MSEPGSSAAGAAGAAADERSRQQILAEREAAREAKKAAKAAKAAKAGKKGGEASGDGDQADAKAASSAKEKAIAKPAQKAAAAGPQSNGAPVKLKSAESGKAEVPRIQNADRATGKGITGSRDTTEQHDAMLPPLLAGGINLFSNVVPAKHPRDIRQLVVAASLSGTIHPSVLQLAQHLASYSIVGADARAIATLQALRDVVLDYRVPPGETLTRDLIAKLKPQIDVLQQARPLGVSVAHAIRYLNFEISNTSNTYDEHEAKAHIVERIDHFVRDRITYATQAIAAKVTQDKIRDRDVILTYGKSSVVEHTLIEARRKGIDFHVIVIDARPHSEGRRLLAALEREGIACTYGLVSSLSVLVRRASLVLLGTASLLGNGALYARCGTAACAMAAHAQGTPVIVCCETYKFSEHIRLDALSLNEASPPTELLSGSDSIRDAFLSTPAAWETQASQSSVATQPGLLNLMYDVTPPRFVTAVASEVGFSTPESVGVILRDYKSVLYVQ